MCNSTLRIVQRWRRFVVSECLLVSEELTISSDNDYLFDKQTYDDRPLF